MRLDVAALACGIALACFVSCGGNSSNDASGGKKGTGGSSGSSSGRGGTGGAAGEAQSGGASGRGGTSSRGGTSAGGSSGAGNTSGTGGETGEAGGGAAGASGVGGDGGDGILGPVTVTGSKNLSTDPLTPGRTCPEARSFRVSTLSARGAKLDSAPDSDCLAAGDEVLLVNLQGSLASHDNVGNWELLTVRLISAAEVGFTTNKVRFYGVTPDSDSGVGTAATDQKVALIRVPRFSSLTIAEGATLRAGAWDGAQGGVLALRADQLDVRGRIDASALGYRSGRWSRDSGDCDDNLATESGESISGPGVPGTFRNIGGPGGLGALNDLPYNSNSPMSPSAAHALPGEPGSNPNGRTLGQPGAAYGINDATLLTMGSGASGNVTCDFTVTEPIYIEQPYSGGGIVLLLADELTVAPTGSISATPPDATRDVSSSGGYVYVRGTTISVGSGRVSAQGSVARSLNAVPAPSNQASPGYIVLEAPTVTGTTDPPANVIN